MRTSVFAILVLGACSLPALAGQKIVVAEPAAPAPAIESSATDLAKRDLVEGILRDARQAAGKELDARFRAAAAEKLLALPAEELARIAREGEGLKTVIAKSLGSSTSDLVYTALSPCRIYDTRTGSGVQGAGSGPLTPGATRSIDVSGGAAACGVPFPAAKSAVLNFTVVTPAGAGDLRAWPWDSSNPPAPSSSIVNYAAITGLNIANGLVVPICNTSTATSGSCNHDLFLRADSHATHLVIDVLGYFAAPVETPLSCEYLSAPFSAAVGTQFNIGSPSCDAGYTLTGGGIELGTAWTSGDELLGSNPFSGIEWQCIGYNGGGNTWTGNCWAVCCRVPGR